MLDIARPAVRRAAAAGGAVTLSAALLAGGMPAGAAGPLPVKLSEFKVAPGKGGARHGRVTFSVRNTGSMVHELVVIRTGKKAAQLASGGKASEKGAVGEVELGAGKTRRLSLTLKQGHYALVCNIGGHYNAGMHADFTVR